MFGRSGKDYNSNTNVVISPRKIKTVERWLVSANGNRIYTLIKRPSSVLHSNLKFPAIIIVPGGLSSGIPYLDSEPFNNLAADGYIVVAFNPQGRGSGENGDPKSEGEENYNGFTHQDDLKSVIEETMSLSNVDSESIGIVSFSYGISMSAGCLARYQNLKVKYLIDYEGPSDSYVIIGDPWLLDDLSENDKTDELYATFGHLSIEKDPSSSNIEWWEEREALRYIGLIRAAYLRIQSYWDHMQPPNEEYQSGFDKPPEWYQNKHAIDMINAATNGQSPWTRMNGSNLNNKINALYSREDQPIYYSGGLDFSSQEFSEIIINAIKNMISIKL